MNDFGVVIAIGLEAGYLGAAWGYARGERRGAIMGCLHDLQAVAVGSCAFVASILWAVIIVTGIGLWGVVAGFVALVLVVVLIVAHIFGLAFLAERQMGLCRKDH